MRTALALAAALAGALPAAAQAADGPFSAAVERTMGWVTGREPEPKAAPIPQMQAPATRPEPMALSGQYTRGRIEAPEAAAPPPPPPGRYLAAAPPPYRVFTPQIPLPLQAQTQRTAALPASLYSNASVAPAAPAPQAQPTRIALRPAQPAPLTRAQAPTPAAPARVAVQAPAPVQAPQQQMAAATPRPVGGATHYYSVHRDYGLAPDAIPETPSDNRYVLIGPSNNGVGGQDESRDDDAPDRRPDAF